LTTKIYQNLFVLVYVYLNQLASILIIEVISIFVYLSRWVKIMNFGQSIDQS